MPSLAVLSLAAMSCADSAQDAGHEHAAEHEEEDDFKGCPTEIPVFEPGSRAQGDHFALRVLSAMPNEPERYTNTWNVELSALAGENTTAQITRGRTFMPIHGHDGRVEPTIRPLATPGQFEIDSLSFTMRGPWEAQFWLRDASMIEDYIVLRVCVAR